MAELTETEKRKKTVRTVIEWVMINFGTVMLAFGVYLFKTPNNFATGGVSGLSIIIARFVTPLVPWLGVTEIMWIFNVVLLIIGFIFLGKGCTFKTAYCTLVYTAEMSLIKLVIPESALPLTDNVFLELCYAMLLTGIGSAILFNCKASSGGTDIIALIIKKYANINVGIGVLIADSFIAASTFFIFDVKTGLYSMLGLFVKAFVVDGVIESIGKNKYVTVITANPELIEKYILEGLHRGYTSYKAQGGYTGEERTVIIAVCRRGEAIKLKSKIHQTDPNAFVILTDTTEIFGKGFIESN